MSSSKSYTNQGRQTNFDDILVQKKRKKQSLGEDASEVTRIRKAIDENNTEYATTKKKKSSHRSKAANPPPPKRRKRQKTTEDSTSESEASTSNQSSESDNDDSDDEEVVNQPHNIRKKLPSLKYAAKATTRNERYVQVRASSAMSQEAIQDVVDKVGVFGYHLQAKKRDYDQSKFQKIWPDDLEIFHRMLTTCKMWYVRHLDIHEDAISNLINDSVGSVVDPDSEAFRYAWNKIKNWRKNWQQLLVKRAQAYQSKFMVDNNLSDLRDDQQAAAYQRLFSAIYISRLFNSICGGTIDWEATLKSPKVKEFYLNVWSYLMVFLHREAVRTMSRSVVLQNIRLLGTIEPRDSIGNKDYILHPPKPAESRRGRKDCTPTDLLEVFTEFTRLSCPEVGPDGTEIDRELDITIPEAAFTPEVDEPGVRIDAIQAISNENAGPNADANLVAVQRNHDRVELVGGRDALINTNSTTRGAEMLPKGGKTKTTKLTMESDEITILGSRAVTPMRSDDDFSDFEDDEDEEDDEDDQNETSKFNYLWQQTQSNPPTENRDKSMPLFRPLTTTPLSKFATPPGVSNDARIHPKSTVSNQDRPGNAPSNTPFPQPPTATPPPINTAGPTTTDAESTDMPPPKRKRGRPPGLPKLIAATTTTPKVTRTTRSQSTRKE